MNKRGIIAVANAAVAALLLSGCVTNDEGGRTRKVDAASVGADAEASKLVPVKVRETGELRIATHVPYPPNEYRDPDGNFAGWAVQLTDAVAARLGLEPKWQDAAFEKIIPQIQAGAIDLGSASFTDTAERQRVVDFVDYYEAGVLWAAPKGSGITPDSACGRKIAVKQGSVQHLDELPEKSRACEDAGEAAISIVPFDDQAAVTNAVRMGQAEAFSADSPVALDAIARSDGRLVPVGEAFDVAPYGFVLAKGSPMTGAVRAALQSLIDDGTYGRILEDAGVERGAVREASINLGE